MLIENESRSATCNLKWRIEAILEAGNMRWMSFVVRSIAIELAPMPFDRKLSGVIWRTFGSTLSSPRTRGSKLRTEARKMDSRVRGNDGIVEAACLYRIAGFDVELPSSERIRLTVQRTFAAVASISINAPGSARPAIWKAERTGLLGCSLVEKNLV